MERKKYLLVASIVCGLLPVFGKNNSAIYKAYVQGNMQDWKKTMDAYKPSTNEQKLEVINYQYGYIAYCIGTEKDEEAKSYLQKAELLTSKLEQQQYKLPMIYAYQSAFEGFQIGLSPYKAPFIGPQSKALALKSVDLDSNNYFVYIQLGNIAFYTPPLLGGSKAEAMKNYLKALSLMEKHPDDLKYNWNYLNLLATIINAYSELGNYELAQTYCIKTLAIEPEFDWVKNKLYPKIIKILKDE